MPNEVKTITRKQLYEKVWSTPMTAISKEYGLSDVGMAKLCKRHNIPRPPRGYWARVEHGQKPPKVELPNPDQDANIEIHAIRRKTRWIRKCRPMPMRLLKSWARFPSGTICGDAII